MGALSGGRGGALPLQEGGLRGPLSPTGLCAPGDLWPVQPVCVTGGFSCALESGGPAVLPPPAPVPSRYVLPRPGDQRTGQGAGPHGGPAPASSAAPPPGCCHLPFRAPRDGGKPGRKRSTQPVTTSVLSFLNGKDELFMY